MASQNINPQITTLNESLDLGTQIWNQIGESLIKNNLALAGLKGAFEATTRFIKQGLGEANTLQSKTLSINKTLTQLTRGNNAQLAALAGGFSETTQSLLDLRRAGFDQLNPRILQMSNHMKATGQGTAALHKMNQGLLVQGGMTEGSINNLAEDLLYNTAQHGIATTDLIGSINQLQTKMGTFGQLGIAGPMADAVSDLTARMGAAYAKPIGDFARQLADPATGSALLTRLGLVDIAADIRQNKGISADKLMEAIKAASAESQKFTGGAAQSRIGEVFTQMLAFTGGEGGLGQLGEQLDRAIVKPEGPEQALLQQFADFNTIMGEILEPLKQGFSMILQPILWILEGIKPILKFLVATIFPTLIGILSWGIAILVKTFALSTMQFVASKFQAATHAIMSGNLIGALHRNTTALWANAMKISGGGLVGIAVGLVAMGVAMHQMGALEEERLAMEKNEKLDAQRRHQTTLKGTNSFMEMARAISADAGLGMAFRPDVLDPIRRDEMARAIIEYLQQIAAGVAVEPSKALQVILSN